MSTNEINIEAVNARAKEAQTPMTKIPSVEKEILKWMNAYIPEGKTVPVFEDMLEQYATTERTALLTELREWAFEHQGQYQGKMAYSVFTDLQAHLDELIKSNNP